MRINRIKKQTVLSGAKARLLARLKADGYVATSGTNYYVGYEGADITELKRFANDIRQVYGVEPKWVKNESGKKPGKWNWKVYIRSIETHRDLENFGNFGSRSWSVPTQIKNSPRRLKQEFLKTFFEDEGSVIISSRLVRLYSINLAGLEEIRTLLEEFGIFASIRGGFGAARNVFAIEIKKPSLKAFRQEIGFLSERKKKALSKLLAQI